MSKFNVNIFGEEHIRVVRNAKKAKALLMEAQATGTPAYARPVSWESSESNLYNGAFRAYVTQRRQEARSRREALRQRFVTTDPGKRLVTLTYIVRRNGVTERSEVQQALSTPSALKKLMLEGLKWYVDASAEYAAIYASYADTGEYITHVCSK